MSATFTLFTDGSCPKPGGPGGWASICIEDRSLDRGLGDPETTNNQMELMGVIGGLRALPAGSTVTIYSDSEYVIKGFTEWRASWKLHGWPARVKNRELWLTLEEEVARHKKVTFLHVKGHKSKAAMAAMEPEQRERHEWNHVADRQAGEQTKLMRRKLQSAS